jgi:beta-phosphoglucomutase-like phosphatase (HAD superfamily)
MEINMDSIRKQVEIAGRMILAILFDMDGTLVRTEDFKQVCLLVAARSFGVQVKPVDLLAFLGVSRDQWSELGPKILGPRWKEIKQVRDQALVEYFAAYPLPMCDGAKDFLGYLGRINFPRGLYTTTNESPMGSVIVQNSGLDKCFPVGTMIFGDGVPEGRGKPFPDGYVEIAKRLGVPIENCLIIEDSPRGLQAAKESGALAALIPGMASFSDEERAMADITYPSLAELHQAFVGQIWDEESNWS